MRIKFPAGFALFLCCALTAYANPPVFSYSPGPLLLAPVALVAEAFVITKLLGKHGFHCFKIFWTWMGITLATCGLMNLGIYVGGFNNFYIYYGNIFPGFSLLFVVEGLVVLIEAAIIMLISKSAAFRTPVTSFTWRTALLVSLVGNLVSFGIGLIALLATLAIT